MSANTNNQRPNIVTVVAIMTLISGIVNIFWGLIASIALLSNIISIIFLPACIPFTAVPAVLGIFEIIYATKLLGTPPQPIRPSTSIAVLEIASLLYGNVFAMIVGILALVFYNDLIAKAYFEEINRPRSPSRSANPVLHEPEQAPAEPSPEAPTTPEPAKEPAEPSDPRRPRKVA
jgi:hypothetical protein